MLTSFFDKLEDPRRNYGRFTYKFTDIILMSITAILSGMNTWEEIADWCECELSWFNEYLGSKYELSPSHDTFNRLFSLIKKDKFEECVRDLIRSVSKVAGHVAVDGKTSRGSGRYGKGAIHTINAYAVESGLAIASQSCDGKGCEIKGIKEILSSIELKGMLISIDAIGCQTDICEKITQSKGDYLIAVKGNQPTLFEDIKNEFEMNTDVKVILGELDKRGQNIHQNKYYFLDNKLPKDTKEKWGHIKTIIKEEKFIDETIHTQRYFISSSIDIVYLSKVTRNHWAVENNLHWVLDVYFKDDASTSYKNNSAHNFAVLRRIAFNGIKLIKPEKTTIRKTRLMIDKNFSFRAKALIALGFKCV